MFGRIGIAVTFAMVFGGYVMAGGKMGVITEDGGVHTGAAQPAGFSCGAQRAAR